MKMKRLRRDAGRRLESEASQTELEDCKRTRARTTEDKDVGRRVQGPPLHNEEITDQPESLEMELQHHQRREL